MHRTIFMFSGQGSQYYHALESLFKKSKIFKNTMQYLDEIAMDIMGASVLDHIYDHKKKKSDPFDSLAFSHPALFMQQYALSQTLFDMGIKPDFVMGASLGEFVSAAVSGVLSAKDALGAVIRQARDIEENCRPGGGMIAVLDDHRLYNSTPVMRENSVLAGVNFDSHFVISGMDHKLKLISSFLERKKIIFIRLPVSYAFHSHEIGPARASFTRFLKRLPFRKPKISLISCLKARQISAISDDYLWEIAIKPIRFMETVRNLEKKESYIYLDLGPSGTLANFVKANLDSGPKFDGSTSSCMALATPFSDSTDLLEKAQKMVSHQSDKPIRRIKGMKTYVFPGQGAQKKGMGESLFDDFKESAEKASEILGYDIKELCLENPENRLGQTEFTQPALYVVNALSWLKKKAGDNAPPDFTAGHSLGEYNALFAAGVFDFQTGLTLVKERGRLMAQARGGGMAAVMGVDEEQIKGVIEKSGFKNISVANYNSDHQIVISGDKEEIEKAEAVFKQAGAKMYFILPVSGAFHTSHMQKAKEEFGLFLKKFKFNPLEIPVISNVTAMPYETDNIEKCLTDQIVSPVRWTESIRYLKGRGEMRFQEIGPGKVLTGLIAKIKDPEPETESRNKSANMDAPELESKKQNQTADIEKPAPETEFATPAPTMENQKAKNAATPAPAGNNQITALSLGNKEFREEYGLKYAYLTGAMANGIASKELVIAVGNAGMMGFFGTGGLGLDRVEQDIIAIKEALSDKPYGMNLLHSPESPETEEKYVDLYMRHGVAHVEAAAFMQMTPALVKYRLAGLYKKDNGEIGAKNKIMGKVSRPEIAEAFYSPAPKRIVKKLLDAGKVTREQAELSENIPMADSLCVEADSGGHTDQGVASAIIPAILNLRTEMADKYGYKKKIFTGAAGGIGTPEAAAAAFILGADFILTGSINQCTVEARISDMAKEMLSQMNVQDTDYAPAGDMFEIGARVQVLRKGVFFPARANKLYALYKQCDSLDDIDEKTRGQIQKLYFKKSFDDIFEETKAYKIKSGKSGQIEKAEKDPKYKMALIFKWYFGHSMDAAMEGRQEDKVNFQIYTGPALGAFNQWVKGSDLSDWRNRRVDKIGVTLMEATAMLLNSRFETLKGID